jgi:large subunit ribosomal protein L6
VKNLAIFTTEEQGINREAMSRIGKQPIDIPDGVNVAVDPGRVTVNGPLGELTQKVPARIKIEKQDGQLVVTRPTERGDDRALHGLTRSLVANMVEGVTNGFEKRLEIQGVGYRASLRGTALELNVGFSHPVVMDAPAGITFEVPTQNEVVIKGIDKQQVGEIAAEVRDVRPPEPYKGKGIRYQGEYVRRKVGKRA